MNINRVTLAGYAGKDARTASTPAGLISTRFDLATTKRKRDRDGKWHEKTEWHQCVAYDNLADEAARVVRGAHVFIEGELSYRDSRRRIETDSGPVIVKWPVTEIVIEASSIIERTPAVDRGPLPVQAMLLDTAS